MRWVQALPPQYIAQLKQADDSMLIQFAKILTQNILLLRQADSAEIGVTPEEWRACRSTIVASSIPFESKWVSTKRVWGIRAGPRRTGTKSRR